MRYFIAKHEEVRGKNEKKRDFFNFFIFFQENNAFLLAFPKQKQANLINYEEIAIIIIKARNFES